MKIRSAFLFLFILVPLIAMGSEGESHGDPFASVFESLAIILLCALIGRFIANKLKQSTVLGELLMGIALGALLTSLDRPVIHIIRNQEIVQEVVNKVESGEVLSAAVDETLAQSALSANAKEHLSATLKSDDVASVANQARYIQLFSTIGISILLFMVGLEGSIEELLSVGTKAIIIAVMGVTVSIGLGYGALLLLLSSSADPRLAFFGGATIASTSAGITARVLKDLEKLNTAEAKITMGAAVFDDILGLILLAVLANVMAAGSLDAGTLGIILLKIILFLVGVFFFGIKILPRILPVFERIDPKSIRLLFPIILMLTFCYLANLIGLAMIIGAYFAGLMITDTLFKSPKSRGVTVESLVAPLEGIFVPVFFVLMGMQVDIALFGNGSVLLIGLVLSAAAILGKLGVGIFLPASFKKIAVGWGMVPRGEVVLIFANIGKSLGIISPEFYAATVLVILVTVLLAPIALNRVYSEVK